MTIENLKWPHRIRKQLWIRMVGRARIMRIVSIWKVILFFLTVSRPICGALTLEESDVQKTVALTTSLTKNEQVLTVSTGQFLVGEIVSVEIKVKNGLDHDLDVTLQPACNCTNLSTTEMSAASGNDLTFQATITMPSSPQTLTSGIQFVDRKRAISFVLAINATIVDFVAIERTPIEIENSDHDAIASVVLRANSKMIRILSVVSDSDRLKIQQSEGQDPMTLMLQIEPTKSVGVLAETLPILVRYSKTAPSDMLSETGLVGELNDVSALNLLVPVRYMDRFSLGPRDTTWKLENGRFIAKMYLVGKDPLTKVSSGKLTLSDGKTSIPVQLSNVQKRGEKSALFEVSCNEMDGKKLDGGDSWRIALVCGNRGGSSSVRVDVSKSE